jgi:hypothetical protein
MVLPISDIDPHVVDKQIQMLDKLKLHHHAFGHLLLRRYFLMTRLNKSVAILEEEHQLWN